MQYSCGSAGNGASRGAGLIHATRAHPTSTNRDGIGISIIVGFRLLIEENRGIDTGHHGDSIQADTLEIRENAWFRGRGGGMFATRL